MVRDRIGTAACARLGIVLADVERGEAGDVVVDEIADRLRVPDPLAIVIKLRVELLWRADGETETAYTEFAGKAVTARTAAGHPHRRMRLLHRLGDDNALGQVHVLPLVAGELS